MTVFFDTNVLIDHALNRRTGYPDEATALLDLCESGKLKGRISAGSVYTLTYVLEKAGYRGTGLRTKLKNYFSLVEPVPTDIGVFQEALESTFKDLEDSYQYLTAQRAGCTQFITGNVKDFQLHQRVDLPVRTPGDFLAYFRHRSA